MNGVIPSYWGDLTHSCYGAPDRSFTCAVSMINQAVLTLNYVGVKLDIYLRRAQLRVYLPWCMPQTVLGHRYPNLMQQLVLTVILSLAYV